MKKKILLVDDDNVSHFIHRRLLEVTGWAEHIYTANNGKEAIDYINESYERSSPLPDIIFLDLNMPVMNGFKFIETLRALSHIPQEEIEIVVLSSSSHELDKEHAFKLGISYYFSKPLSVQAINTLFCVE